VLSDVCHALRIKFHRNKLSLAPPPAHQPPQHTLPPVRALSQLHLLRRARADTWPTHFVLLWPLPCCLPACLPAALQSPTDPDAEQFDDILDLDFTSITRVTVRPHTRQPGSASGTSGAGAGVPIGGATGLFIAELQTAAFPECLGADVLCAAEDAVAAGALSSFKLGLLLEEAAASKFMHALRDQVYSGACCAGCAAPHCGQLVF
jgi:hypothetical protein